MRFHVLTELVCSIMMEIVSDLDIETQRALRIVFLIVIDVIGSSNLLSRQIGSITTAVTFYILYERMI